MKKESNRNMVPYPIYPPYQNVNPMMMGQMGGGMPAPTMMPYPSPMPISMPSSDGCSASSSSSQYMALKEEIDNLNKRVSYLENNLLTTNSGTNYSASNYQVM